MNEQVLAVATDYLSSVLRQGFFEEPTAEIFSIIESKGIFLDREEAEKDPSYKQIIPYTVVSFKRQYLLYRRTKKQGENRLHNKMSLGFGGHINPEDNETGRNTNLILSGLAREINEEIFIPGFRAITHRGFIYDDSTPVGSVHLGVVFEMESFSSQYSVNEEDMIEASWSNIDEIAAIEDRLETWSQFYFRSVLAKPND